MRLARFVDTLDSGGSDVDMFSEQRNALSEMLRVLRTDNSGKPNLAPAVSAVETFVPGAMGIADAIEQIKATAGADVANAVGMFLWKR